jgi:hypothetical protein
MKKIILAFFAIGAFVNNGNAQLNIYVDGTTVDISGQTHTINLTSAIVEQNIVDFIVDNDSGFDQPWKVTRINLTQPTNWENYFCWGSAGQFGECYDPYPDSIWTGGSVNIKADSSGRISVYVTAPDYGCATYRYKISTDEVNFLDSVDLSVCYALGLEEQMKVDFTIAPNPSSDFVTITTPEISEGRLTLTNSAGSVVYREDISGEKTTMDLRNYTSGTYFLSIEAEGKLTTTQKLTVRH